MEYNLPKLTQQTSDASTEQAKNLIADATSMAGNYLQGLKTMAGIAPNQTAKTMPREQMDRDNALKMASLYMGTSGRVPEMDFLNKQGLSDVLGPIAGQNTFEAQQIYDDLAMKWYNANNKKVAAAKEPTAKETLDAIRSGAIKYAQNLVAGNPFTVERGLEKGKTYLESGKTAEEAAQETINMLNSQLGEMNLSDSQYEDIVKQIYRSLGMDPSNKDNDVLAQLLNK